MRVMILGILFLLSLLSLVHAFANEDTASKTTSEDSTYETATKNTAFRKAYGPLMRKYALKLQDLAVAEPDQTQRELLWSLTKRYIEAADVMRAEEDYIELLIKVTKIQETKILNLQNEIIRLETESKNVQKI